MFHEFIHNQQIFSTDKTKKYKKNLRSHLKMSSMVLKVILVCIVCICSAWSTEVPLASQNQAALDAWESFLKTYQKSYSTDEEYHKRQVQDCEPAECRLNFSSTNSLFAERSNSSRITKHLTSKAGSSCQLDHLTKQASLSFQIWFVFLFDLLCM